MAVLTNESVEFKKLFITNGNHTRMYDFLIQDESDYKEFIRSSYNGNVVRSLVAYRQLKIRKLNVSLSDFLTLEKKDRVEAFEKLFQEAIPTELIKKFFGSKGITVTELFYKAKENPTETFISLLKGWDTLGKVYAEEDFLLI